MQNNALHLSLICVILKCWIQFIGMVFLQTRKVEKVWT